MSYVQHARDILAKKIEIENDLLDLYTLLVFVKGVGCTLADVHDAWSIWRVKTKPVHKSIVPFSELSKETQELDREYTDAIRETAREIVS